MNASLMLTHGNQAFLPSREGVSENNPVSIHDLRNTNLREGANSPCIYQRWMVTDSLQNVRSGTACLSSFRNM